MSTRPELATLTADMAEAAGIPVFVWCLACASPSRELNLKTIQDRGLGERSIASLAAAGRFRCTRCGKRALDIMPTLDLLVIQRRRLRVRCLLCNKDQALSARAAVERFGLAMPFDQLRRTVQCREGCQASAGAMSVGETTDRNARAYFPARPAAKTDPG